MRIPLLFFCVVAFLLTPLELLNAAERYWIASSAKNWNDASGWSETPGGAGGATAPESGDRAFFGAYGAGNCTVTASITVDRIEIASAYTGIVSQSSGVTVMTGSLVVDGAFRLGANGKLQLTDTDVPLSGSGTLDTSTNTPNTVEYAGGDEIEIASGTPVSAYHHLTLTPPGGISRTGVFVGNANEQYYDMAAVDSAGGYLYIGTKNSPAKIVKIRLSDFTRVGTLTLASGEKDLSPAVVMDSAAGFMYVGTRTTPGRVVKIQLSDFTRVGAITLNSGEDQLWSAALDGANGYAYFGTRTSPARIVKVQLSDFTRHSALTLASGENEALGACLDAAAGFAYFGLQTYPGKVVKVRLSDFTAMGTLTFNSGEDRIRVGVLDAAAGYAYFSTRTSPGKVVRVKLADFTHDAVLTMESGENELYSGVIDTEGGHAFFGTYTNPGKVIKVKLEDFTRADAATFGFNEKQLDTAAIDAANGYAYFMTDNWTGKAVKVNLKHVDAEWTHSGALDVNGNLAIGAGVLNSAGQNIAVGGGWSNAGTFNAGLNTVTLDGGSQSVSGHNTFRNLTKIITSAATLTFESGKTQQVAGALNLQGASGQLLSVLASQSGQPWRLVAENYQTARYADVKDTDASEGRALVALHSSDSGNNANVIFTAPALVSISTPNTSVTSPAWVEGANSADVSSVAVAVNSGTAFDAVRLSPTKWFADNASSGGASFGVTLSPTAATNVEVVVANPFTESNSATQNITWTATNLTGQSYSEDTVRIRKGDSLLLTATGTGTTLEIDGHGDGTFEHSGAPGALFSTAYPTAGTFVAKARIDSVEAGTLTVVVIGVNLHGPIACEVGFQREKDVDVSPASETGEVSFAANDGFWMTASVKQAIATGATLYLKPLRRGTPVLEARLNGATAPLLARQEVDEFTRNTPALLSALINDTTDVGGTTLIMRPYIPNVRWQFDMFASTATFGGGLTSLSVNTSDTEFEEVFDPHTGESIGQLLIELELPSEEDKYCFNAKALQASSPEKVVAGAEGVNGGPCKARIDKLVLCPGDKRKLQMELTVRKEGGEKHDVVIQGGPAEATKPKFTKSDSQVCPKCFDCGKAVGVQEEEVFADAATTGEYDVKIGEAIFEKVIQITDKKVEINLKHRGTFTHSPKYALVPRGLAVTAISTSSLGASTPRLPNNVNGDGFYNPIEIQGKICSEADLGLRLTCKQSAKSKLWTLTNFPNEAPPRTELTLITSTDSPNDDPSTDYTDGDPSGDGEGMCFSADAPGFKFETFDKNHRKGTIYALRQVFQTYWVDAAGNQVSDVMRWTSAITVIKTGDVGEDIWARTKEGNYVDVGSGPDSSLDVTKDELLKIFNNNFTP